MADAVWLRREAAREIMRVPTWSGKHPSEMSGISPEPGGVLLRGGLLIGARNEGSGGLLQIERHPFRHRDTVLVAQVSVRHRYEHAAIFVSQPASDHLEIASCLNGV